MHENVTWDKCIIKWRIIFKISTRIYVYSHARQVKWGGTHRFNDTFDVESKHRISLKAHGNKIRVRTDTQTEQDLLRCVQEEVVFETLDDLLLMEADDPDVTLTDEIKAYRKQFKQVQTVTLTVPLHIDKYVDRDHHGRLVHQEVLLSWGEVLRMFAHCFPLLPIPGHKTKPSGGYTNMLYNTRMLHDTTIGLLTAGIQLFSGVGHAVGGTRYASMVSTDNTSQR